MQGRGSSRTSLGSTVILYCYDLQRNSLTSWPISVCIQCIPLKLQEIIFYRTWRASDLLWTINSLFWFGLIGKSLRQRLSAAWGSIRHFFYPLLQQNVWFTNNTVVLTQAWRTSPMHRWESTTHNLCTLLGGISTVCIAIVFIFYILYSHWLFSFSIYYILNIFKYISEYGLLLYVIWAFIYLYELTIYIYIYIYIYI